MKLYEIEANIEQAILNMFESEDEETGEVSQEAVDALDALKAERELKIDNIGCYIKNIKAEAKAIKEEEDALKKRRVALEHKAERLTNFLSMHVGTDEKFTSNRVVVSFRKSMKVDITNESIIPKKWLRIKTEPDKVAIKHALDEGIKVKGCQLIENYSIQIK